MMVTSAIRRVSSTVRTISLVTARISCLRSRSVVVGAWKTALTSAPARVIQSSSSGVRATGRRPFWAARSCSARRSVASLSSRARSRVPGDQPVLRFDRVVLAHRAAGVEAGALDGGLEHGEAGPPLLLGLGHGLGGRGQRDGLQHLEQLVQHQLLDLAAADGLADPLGPEVELGLDALVARTAAGPAGCAA
jgi:hypothetical protein